MRYSLGCLVQLANDHSGICTSNFPTSSLLGPESTRIDFFGNGKPGIASVPPSLTHDMTRHDAAVWPYQKIFCPSIAGAVLLRQEVPNTLKDPRLCPGQDIKRPGTNIHIDCASTVRRNATILCSSQRSQEARPPTQEGAGFKITVAMAAAIYLPMRQHVRRLLQDHSTTAELRR